MKLIYVASCVKCPIKDFRNKTDTDLENYPFCILVREFIPKDVMDNELIWDKCTLPNET